MVTLLSKFVTAYVCRAQFVFNWLEAKLMILRYKKHLKIKKKKLFTGQKKGTMCAFPVQGFIFEFGFFDGNLRVLKLFIFK